MIRSPAIWIITSMVVGFTVWLLWTSRPAPLETGMEALNGTQQGDRDSAAEEVRAVATQITEISDKLEDIETRQSGETDRIRQENEQSIAGIRETIESLKDQTRTPPEVIESLAQIGDRLTALEISLDDGGHVDFEYPVGSAASPSIIWIEPLDGPSSAALEVDGIGDLIPTDIALRGEEPPADPRYTIPPSSIVYATAITSLVGRIPVNGRIETPWRFKLISSGRNLTSRRFEVPGLEGVIWTGIAHGDYTLSCVSGTIDTVSYVFDDGSVDTQRSPVDPDDITNGIGWISDDRGNPCIKGDLKTNVPQAIRRSVVAGTFSGLARGYADAQSTRSTDSSGTTSTTVTGDSAEYALGVCSVRSHKRIQSVAATASGPVFRCDLCSGRPGSGDTHRTAGAHRRTAWRPPPRPQRPEIGSTGGKRCEIWQSGLASQRQYWPAAAQAADWSLRCRTVA